MGILFHWPMLKNNSHTCYSHCCFFFLLRSTSLPPLDSPLPSQCGQCELKMEIQPKLHHRAHYETEGSRGAIKSDCGRHPVVKVRLYTRYQISLLWFPPQLTMVYFWGLATYFFWKMWVKPVWKQSFLLFQLVSLMNYTWNFLHVIYWLWLIIDGVFHPSWPTFLCCFCSSHSVQNVLCTFWTVHWNCTSVFIVLINLERVPHLKVCCSSDICSSTRQKHQIIVWVYLIIYIIIN